MVELEQIYCHRFSELSPLNSTHFVHFASGEETPEKQKSVICLAAQSAVQQRPLSSPTLESRRLSKSFFRFLNGWAPDLGYRVDNLIHQSDNLVRQQLLSVTLIGNSNFSFSVLATYFLIPLTSVSIWTKFIYREDGCSNCPRNFWTYFLSYTTLWSLWRVETPRVTFPSFSSHFRRTGISTYCRLAQ